MSSWLGELLGWPEPRAWFNTDVWGREHRKAEAMNEVFHFMHSPSQAQMENRALYFKIYLHFRKLKRASLFNLAPLYHSTIIPASRIYVSEKTKGYLTNSPYSNIHPISCHSNAALFKDMCNYKFDSFLSG